MWIKYSDIDDLPQGVWDNYISRGDVCLDKRLIAVAQKVYISSRFEYFVCYDGDKPCAVFMAVTTGDYAETGCDETTGQHFWFDPNVFTFDRFIAQSRALVESKTLVYRDFYGEHNDDYARVMDVSRIEIPKNITTLDQYISTLKYKYRYQLSQYRSALDPEKYIVERIVDFMPLIDILYPLYVEVCDRAKEYRAAPHPKEYFLYVKQYFGDDAVVIAIRNTEGAYLGFMLLLYTSTSCVHQYIGFKRIDDLYLWHNLTIESINDAIARGVRSINMGVTNSVAKHKFGAKSLECYTLTVK